MPLDVAIIGAGPAGCALACFLKERGLDCVVYDNSKPPSLLVGESLVPAVIPILRRLNIEDRVAAISQVKRGAALRRANGNRVDFKFRNFGRTYPDYSYNIPRPQFDHIVRQRAEELGVRFIEHKAHVEHNPDSGRELNLDTLSLEKAGLDAKSHPKLLIDATGRSRLFSKALDIPAVRGQRNDVAHFAHFKNFASDSIVEGQVVLTALECGWSWQIPLKEVTSVGVVMDAKAAKVYGKTPEARLKNAIRLNPLLNQASSGSRCVSHTMTYSNYQLLSEKAHGNGWVLLGDALGFVDPMLSPGVFMTLESASLLDQHLFGQPIDSPGDFSQRCDRYFSEMKEWHNAWSRLIEHFYNGNILSLGEVRQHIRDTSRFFSLNRIGEKVTSRALAKLVSGAGSRSEINHQILFHAFNHALKKKTQADISSNQIHSALSEGATVKLQQIVRD